MPGSGGSLFEYSGQLSCQLTYYAKLRPVAVCIHKEETKL